MSEEDQTGGGDGGGGLLQKRIPISTDLSNLVQLIRQGSQDGIQVHRQVKAQLMVTSVKGFTCGLG